MQSINAPSLAPGVIDWLANSSCPRVLHVFDSACNLINARREVLSIVTPQIGNGPFNLVVEEDVLFSEHLGLQSSISISLDHLTLGNLTINTTGTKLWSPRPDWETLQTKRHDILYNVTKLPITNNQPLLPKSLTTSFSSALATADISSALTITSQLAGLGIGLTPAGDDFIMGAIYAAWIIHPYDIASILAQEISNTASPMTTSLSAAWLRSAGKGEAGILWHEFFDALISDDRAQFEESTGNILARGETSGADALAGFIRTIIASPFSKIPS